MKHFLLTLASAALLSVPATAQSVPNFSLLSTQRTVNTSALNKSSIQLKQGTVLENLSLLKRQSRMDDAVRSHKELSYQVTGTEAANPSIGPIGLKYQDFSNHGIAGYGFAQVFLPDMLSRYVGNTITNIDLVAWKGKYSEALAVIIDLNTGEAVWIGDIENMHGISEDENVDDVNHVACDYQITGKEGPLLIGWVAKVAPDMNDELAEDYGVIMPMYKDNTGAGLGANILILNDKGHLQLMEEDAAHWTDKDGNPETNCACITIQTTGASALKDNDASLLQVGTVRGDLVTGKGANAKVVLSNMGLDPIASFDYTFECDGLSKTGTYTFKEPLSFYTAGMVQLPAQLARQNGSSMGKMTINKVNTVSDEYNKDNAADFNVISISNGFKRTPVVEELTSTFCGWCPFGIAGMEEMRKACSDDIVTIAVHSPFNNSVDPLSAEKSYLQMMQEYGLTSLPTAMINRETEAHPYAEGPAAALEMSSSVCEANMVLKTKKPANALQKDITVTTTIDFAASAPKGYYGIAYVITEDGIEDVKQLNYFAPQYQDFKKQGFSDSEIFEGLGWNETLQKFAKDTNHDKAGNYWLTPVFDDVACTISDPFVEDADSQLPAVEAGKTYTHTAKLPLPKREGIAVNKSNLKVAALLIDRTSGVIVTGRQVKLGETSVASGVEEVATQATAEIEVAEGAFNVTAKNAVAQVYTVDGKLVSSATVNGKASLPTFGKGVFVIRVVEGNNVTTQKAVF